MEDRDMEEREQIRWPKREPGSGHELEERYAYYRRCQVVRTGGQCKAPAMKDRQVCYKHAEQRERARQCQQEMADVLMEGAARTGIEIRNLMRDPRGKQRIFAAVAQGILDGIIGEDAARLLLKELAR
jgi:hypothetical protein